MNDNKRSDSQDHIKPFVHKKIVCPVCQEPAVHWYLNDNTYKIQHREPDYFISKYTWLEPEYNRYNLHGFGLWNCRKCLFTDERKAFLQKGFLDKNDPFNALKQVLLDRQNSEDPYIAKIQPLIEYPSSDLLSALNLTLLSIYTHTLPEEEFQDDEKIAKHYLRAAWLLRLTAQKSDIKEIKQFLTQYNERFDLLQSNIMNTLAANEELNQTIVDQHKQKDGTLSWQQQWAKHYPELTSTYKNICTSTDDMISALKTYYKVSTNFKAMLLNADKSILDMPFHDYPQYKDFLAELQQLSHHVPASETEAYRLASEYFHKALQNPEHEKNNIKKFKIYELIIAIKEIQSDVTGAQELCNTLEKSSKEFFKQVSLRIKKEEIMPEARVNNDYLNGLLRHTKDVIRNAMLAQKRIGSLKENTSSRSSAPIDDDDVLDIKVDVETLEIIENEFQEAFETQKSDKKRGIFDRFKF